MPCRDGGVLCGDGDVLWLYGCVLWGDGGVLWWDGGVIYGVVVSMFDFHCSDRGSNLGRGGKIS